jgi:ABC-type multidrug transport system fused ATPase/permease subunit
MYSFGIVASNSLFKQSFQRVIRATKEFFDTTPVGRVLSRFSKDQDVLDTLFIHNISTSMEMYFSMISIFVSR